jgi:predicted anti-sigma-YlaC factor YlaD
VNCRETIDLMDIAIDGVLPTGTRPDFDAHLGACNPCRNYFEQLAATVSALGRLPRPAASNPRRPDLLDRFRRARRIR